MSAGPYAVVAHRWGLRDAHSYVVRVCLDEAEAKAQAALTVEDRGGKYGVEVTDCCGEQIHYVECPYFGAAGQSTPARHAADVAKGILWNQVPTKPGASFDQWWLENCDEGDGTSSVDQKFVAWAAWREAIGRREATIAALLDELDSMVTQYGCECEHPACRKCRATAEARAAIAKGKEAAV